MIQGCTFILLALMMVSLVTGCSSTQITINRLAPPRYPIKGGKLLAVVDFQSPESIPYAGEKFASSFVSQLAPTKYYELMERSRMDSIMAEHRLAQTDYVDPEKVTELGMILNVDYIITGEVTAYSAEDDAFYEQEERRKVVGYYYRRGRKYPRYRTYFVDVPVKIRTATVSASFRLVNVHTSRIIVGESRAKSFQKRGYGSSGIAELPSREHLLNELTDEITAYFTTLIAPYPVKDTRWLEKGKTSQCENGFNLAQNGLWEEAVSAWEQAIAVRPDDPSPYNNLGVAAEIRGEYELASDYYRQALQLNPDKERYMSHLKNAENLVKMYSRSYKE